MSPQRYHNTVVEKSLSLVVDAYSETFIVYGRTIVYFLLGIFVYLFI